MGDIDRQRVAAVKTLQELGLAWHQGAWQTAYDGDLVVEADAMHAQLVARADALAGCVEGTPEEAELASIVASIEAYEGKRWPLDKIPGGKS